jgi:hypothetical protein
MRILKTNITQNTSLIKIAIKIYFDMTVESRKGGTGADVHCQTTAR